MRLPLWVRLAYADVKLWFVTIPVAVALPWLRGMARLGLADWFGS
jgi:hypothetical protein